MRWLLVATGLCSAGLGLVAQTGAKKAPLKPFTPPTILPLVNPVIARDEGCAKDLAKAIDMEGLALRKYAVELFSYGCVEALQGVYRVNFRGTVAYKIGDKTISLGHVFLIPERNGESREVWVLSSQVSSLEGKLAAVHAAIEAAVAEKAAGKK